MRASRVRSAAAPALALVGAALLAGCGTSSSAGNRLAAAPPAQILAAAETAAAHAAAVRVAGSILSEGEPISLNMELLPSKGGAGELTLPGARVELIELDGLMYVKGDAGFLRRLARRAAAVRALAGRWLLAPSRANPLAPLAQLTSVRTLVERTLSQHGPLTRAPDATIAGQRAVAISDRSSHATLYIAATGTPYPLEITVRGRAQGQIRFTRWNEQVTLAPPANPVNLAGLLGGP